jgi:hypothetical protein
MYSPDCGFVKKLKALDPNLDCRFMPSHAHFVITYRRAVGEPVPVLLIESEDGGFRRPDDRDIRKLQEGDTHRVPMRDRLRQVAAYMEREREYGRRKRAELIRDLTKDGRLQLSRAIGKIDHNPGGKWMPFRRINLKPKGKVFSTAA